MDVGREDEDEGTLMSKKHLYEGEEWTKTDYFCPKCGKKRIFISLEGDYYLGPEYRCAECGSNFYNSTGGLR